MAIAQGKSVIPVIKRGLKLPFDVQHLDVIIYDNIEDLKTKLKAPIVATLRKQKAPLANNNDEMRKQVYGPLYNEIDHFLTRKDKFTEFHGSQYSTVITMYKYLLHKTDPMFQKKLTRFYSGIGSFNRELNAAQKAITDIVKNELNRWYPVEDGRDVRMEVAVTSNERQITLPTMEQILIHKVTPQTWYEALETSEKVLSVRYTLQTSGYAARNISLKEGDMFFTNCQADVEKDQEVIKLRKKARALNRKGTELLKMLKRNL